jgi:hypothetical protein
MQHNITTCLFHDDVSDVLEWLRKIWFSSLDSNLLLDETEKNYENDADNTAGFL